jgi:capsular polysaccharide transport system permease protein
MNINAIDRETLREAIQEGGRKKSLLLKYRWFLLFVGLPTFVAAVYYGLIASPVYVSQSTFVIKSPGQKSTPSLSLANLVQASGFSSGQEQTKEVLQYIRSRSALRDLQTRLNVRAIYSNPNADFLSRFPHLFGDSSFESLYRYYGSVVGADADPESGLAVVQVHAFTAKDAYRINSALLDLSEDLVNRLNARAEDRAVAEAQRVVMQAEDRVRNARVALSAYRNQQDIIDPAKQATGLLDVSNHLVTERAALKAQLDLMSRVTPNHPGIPALRARLKALDSIIAGQNAQVAGSPTGIASKLSTYEKLDVEQEFATQMLTAANANLEQARTEAQKQQYYLERVVEPNIPDDPVLPERLKRILVIFGTSLCLYFIGWMVIVGILEHSPED